MIEVDGLSKVYPVSLKDPGLGGTLRHFFRRKTKNVNAVSGVTFRVEPGEAVGFLGPNGAGKTTTLKMLTGLIRPSAGRVLVAGFDPFKRQPAFLHQITLVMGQKQQLLWDLPASETIRINGAVYGLSDATLRTRAGELAEMLGLGEELKQPVRKLSLGERMKCELLCALLHRPMVLFLDEPTLGLDVNAQVAVREFLRDYNQRHKATLVLTSHYMADITALCPRVLLIHQGGLIYDGALDALTARVSPTREIKVDLGQSVTAERLAALGTVRSVQGLSVRFTVPRDGLTRMVSRLLAELDVVDLSITDPPVEDVIARVFRQGDAGIDTAAAGRPPRDPARLEPGP